VDASLNSIFILKAFSNYFEKVFALKVWKGAFSVKHPNIETSRCLDI